MRVFLAETLHQLQHRLVSTDLRFLHLDVLWGSFGCLFRIDSVQHPYSLQLQ